MNTSDKMKVLVIEPEKVPVVQEIERGLESMQKVVGGMIEPFCPYEEPVAILVNEEGKLENLPLNRLVWDDDGNFLDVLAGTMLIVGIHGTEFGSLTDEQIDRFSEKFRVPERFISLNGRLMVIPLEPEEPRQAEPVYRHSAAYAAEHGQRDAYRASHRQNMDCSRAIEKAIADNYSSNRLDPAGAAQVVEQFGLERVQYVLAATIRHMKWDGRYTKENRDWAQTVDIPENKDADGHDRNLDFIAGQAHPGLVNLFTDQVRRLEKEHLQERPSIQEKLQNQPTRSAAAPKKRTDPER